MANDLERTARAALTYLEDVIPNSLVTQGLRTALDAPSSYPTRDQHAAASWEARDAPNALHRPGMTWAHLLECLETNPEQYTSDYERTLRQADAVIALEWSELVDHLKTTILPTESEKNLAIALRIALERPDHDPVRTHLWRIVQGTATSVDWNVIKRAASKRD